MNSNITMNISPILRSGDEKVIYVQFMDGSKIAEFTVPGCILIKNDGYDEKDLKSLQEYLDNEQDEIYKVARQINPISALMK